MAKYTFSWIVCFLLQFNRTMSATNHERGIDPSYRKVHKFRQNIADSTQPSISVAKIFALLNPSGRMRKGSWENRPQKNQYQYFPVTSLTSVYPHFSSSPSWFVTPYLPFTFWFVSPPRNLYPTPVKNGDSITGAEMKSWEPLTVQPVYCYTRGVPPGTKPLRRKTVKFGTTAFAIPLLRPLSSGLLPPRLETTIGGRLPMATS